MANQIALAVLGERGTELIVEESAHIMVAELGGAAMHSGLQTRGLPGYRGRLTPEQVRGAAKSSDGFHVPRASILALENTHNSAGGTVWPVDELDAVVGVARELGLAVHLDGAATTFAQVDAAAIGLTSAEAIGQLAAAGVGLSATVKPGVLRAVTHLDIDDDALERALELVPRALGTLARAGA